MDFYGNQELVQDLVGSGRVHQNEQSNIYNRQGHVVPRVEAVPQTDQSFDNRGQADFVNLEPDYASYRVIVIPNNDCEQIPQSYSG